MRRRKERIKRDWDHWKPSEEEEEELSRYYRTDFSGFTFESIKPFLMLIAFIFVVIMTFRSISDSSITDNAKNMVESVANEGLGEDLDEEDAEDLKEIRELINNGNE